MDFEVRVSQAVYRNGVGSGNLANKTVAVQQVGCPFAAYLTIGAAEDLVGQLRVAIAEAKK